MCNELQIISREEAREKGLRFYATEAPCRRGHLARRLVSTGACVECSRIKNAQPKHKAKRYRYAIDLWNSSEEEMERQRAYSRARSASPRVRAIWAERRGGYHAEKMKTDVQYALRHILRGRFFNAFDRGEKNGSAINLLGCSIEYLKFHLERQFIAGMGWENRGRGPGKWSIDHIMPLTAFDLTDPEQVAEVCNYKNLQPLWNIDNNKKGAKHPIEYARSTGMLL